MTTKFRASVSKAQDGTQSVSLSSAEGSSISGSASLGVQPGGPEFTDGAYYHLSFTEVAEDAAEAEKPAADEAQGDVAGEGGA